MRLRSPATLRALMEQDKFSLGRLARYAGCSKGFISHLLSGRRSSCTPELATRIAEALNVPIEILFDPRMSPAGVQTDKEQVPA
ncbi:helix-turn-helix transcriptional regulator [Mycobacterium sp. CVI_P3]|uniref:Helix-turn-helix transcriptional regulator n=1 Tax=Mycobacterium pinniadriaticum TaxID=2994102 RepID=A0ABT3SE34_9MYCO|nr:helix-turn-helix transcriptional regulator [Mycobacterium pinniadriaticum]MCX2931346.1 helix-turn-helix transcriptional regulator [Mycobacterium pinniadriaticum]MCX2937770.1 helix-turn-helix transcriptional regulator [Mycobacterium pinniadriaticum]